MARPRTDARAELLQRVVDHLAEHGVAGFSLRDLAAQLGTSHRMLVYHFGSKDGLLAEVVRAVEAGQRDQVEALVARGELGPDAVGDHFRAMWAHWVDPATQRQERLFFAMVGQALQGDPAMQPLLDDLVAPWIEPVAAIRVRQGVDAATARLDARIALAVTRGLLLDLLATGDADAVSRAYERFGALFDAAPPRRRPPASVTRPS